MHARVLISPDELTQLIQSGPVVLIDTREAASFAEAHLPGAVNIHEIFTYLATSTPEGLAVLRETFILAIPATKSRYFTAATAHGVPPGCQAQRKSLRRRPSRFPKIPGSVWLEWYRMMKPTPAGQMFKSPAEILAECATVGIRRDTPVVVFCFKGARASNTFVALEEAGIRDVRLYLGSWNEWSRDPSLPIDEGLPY
ncbi:Thiosulfate sulfurtransferase [Pandoraea soli]|uniref:Thiosulfate sulfurtransferase n=1 Tax=Pandoraea soli TaxID=2508293 RepID=A0ABY6VZ34_9BURK|nr:Thiosulfate sulfurtransferase [Pandoraea soli]